jgi:hypothetical protein
MLKVDRALRRAMGNSTPESFRGICLSSRAERTIHLDFL